MLAISRPIGRVDRRLTQAMHSPHHHQQQQEDEDLVVPSPDASARPPPPQARASTTAPVTLAGDLVDHVGGSLLPLSSPLPRGPALRPRAHTVDARLADAISCVPVTPPSQPPQSASSSSTPPTRRRGLLASLFCCFGDECVPRPSKRIASAVLPVETRALPTLPPATSMPSSARAHAPPTGSPVSASTTIMQRDSTAGARTAHPSPLIYARPVIHHESPLMRAINANGGPRVRTPRAKHTAPAAVHAVPSGAVAQSPLALGNAGYFHEPAAFYMPESGLLASARSSIHMHHRSHDSTPTPASRTLDREMASLRVRRHSADSGAISPNSNVHLLQEDTASMRGTSAGQPRLPLRIEQMMIQAQRKRFFATDVPFDPPASVDRTPPHSNTSSVPPTPTATNVMTTSAPIEQRLRAPLPNRCSVMEPEPMIVVQDHEDELDAADPDTSRPPTHIADTALAAHRPPAISTALVTVPEPIDDVSSAYEPDLRRTESRLQHAAKPVGARHRHADSTCTTITRTSSVYSAGHHHNSSHSHSMASSAACGVPATPSLPELQHHCTGSPTPPTHAMSYGGALAPSPAPIGGSSYMELMSMLVPASAGLSPTPLSASYVAPAQPSSALDRDRTTLHGLLSSSRIASASLPLDASPHIDDIGAPTMIQVHGKHKRATS